MSQEIPFDPFPFLHDPHQQTILGSVCNILIEPLSTQKLVPLPDGDTISLEISTPKGWKETDPTVFLVHGLCGSHRSPSLVRMARRLIPEGIRVVRFNMRGCGSGKGLAKQIYHSGRSEDVFYSLQKINEETPESPTTLVGFSLGANIVLKMAGELGTLAKTFLRKVIAVSPPVDLFSSVLLLGDEANGFYERYFYKLLRSDVLYLHKTFPELPKVRLPRDLKLYEFDQLYTAPRCGFTSAHDYYTKCSSLYYVEEISIPCHILLAKDDPIISATSLDRVQLPSNVRVFTTQKGGHMGYLGDPRQEKGLYWLDSLLLDWIREGPSMN